MRTATLLTALAVLVGCGLLPTGCFLDKARYPRSSNPANPFPLRRIAVAPVTNQTAQPVDALEAGEALASELGKFPGFEVLWPRQWTGQASDLPAFLEQARIQKADAVLLATLTDLSTYPPPRIGLAMALYPTGAVGPALKVPYAELAEAGTPYLDRLPQGTAWTAAVGLVLDARDGSVQDRLHGWGLRRDQTGASFDWQRSLYSSEEFRRFAFNEALRRLCEQGEERKAKEAQDKAQDSWKKSLQSHSSNLYLRPTLTCSKS